jgi:hypothetical protein
VSARNKGRISINTGDVSKAVLKAIQAIYLTKSVVFLVILTIKISYVSLINEI